MLSPSCPPYHSSHVPVGKSVLVPTNYETGGSPISTVIPYHGGPPVRRLLDTTPAGGRPTRAIVSPPPRTPRGGGGGGGLGLFSRSAGPPPGWQSMTPARLVERELRGAFDLEY